MYFKKIQLQETENKFQLLKNEEMATKSAENIFYKLTLDYFFSNLSNELNR